MDSMVFNLFYHYFPTSNILMVSCRCVSLSAFETVYFMLEI